MIWKINKVNDKTFEVVDIDTGKTICIAVDEPLLKCLVHNHNEVVDSLVCNIKEVSQ